VPGGAIWCQPAGNHPVAAEEELAVHPYITSQIAQDRHQERLAQAARQRLARGVHDERVVREGDRGRVLRRIRRDRWIGRIRRVPRLAQQLRTRAA
jgi:hypothetical protein